MDSPETLATLGTRHRTLEKTVEGNDEWTVQRHWQHWEQDIEGNDEWRTLEKTVEGNDEWTVQRHWQHWEQDIER